ncbi:ribosome maturation factor RimM [Spiribacter pallidus]|jgi:16S rRNA processing protein RimM|uniref:Ribosome maturation factor RimM n=1 Tax=Spiribacter pallidus TaxID=1987936 RepID=A0ABV3T9Z5_9GAMM
MGTASGDQPDCVVLGEVLGAHGVRGDLRIYSWTRPRENILEYSRWTLGAGSEAEQYKVAATRVQGRHLLARLQGVDHRDAAEALRGQPIVVGRDALPEKGDHEYYWWELKGLAVETRDGHGLGRVSGLMETGANDVLVVDGEKRHLIPYAPGRYVESVDLAAGRMRVDWDPEF